MALVGVRGEDADRVIEVNEALIGLTGLPREQLIGANSFGDLTHPDDVPAVREGMRQLIAGEIAPSALEFRLRVVGRRATAGSTSPRRRSPTTTAGRSTASRQV